MNHDFADRQNDVVRLEEHLRTQISTLKLQSDQSGGTEVTSRLLHYYEEVLELIVNNKGS